MPPCTAGWSVLTRPSRISGKPVSSEIDLAPTPPSTSERSVPPVEKISTPCCSRPRANGTTPVLSETLMIARILPPPETKKAPDIHIRGSAQASGLPYSCLNFLVVPHAISPVVQAACTLSVTEIIVVWPLASSAGGRHIMIVQYTPVQLHTAGSPRVHTPSRPARSRQSGRRGPGPARKQCAL